MKKYVLTFSLVSLLVLSVYLVPRFIYNKLEYDFRMNFSMAMQLEQVADELIAVRQLGKIESISDENFEQIASNIEQALSESIVFTDQAIAIQSNQSKIPFLPKNYIEYHQLKQHLITDHAQLTQDFLVIKENEHLLTDTVQRLFSTQDYLHNLNFEEQDIYEVVEYLDYNTLRVKTQIASLKENDSISPEVYDYLTEQNKPIIQTKDQLQQVIDNESWDAFDPSKISSPPTIHENEVLKIFSDSYNQKRKEELDNHEQKITAHYNEMEEVGSYYLDHHLGYDPISTLLGKFNNTYPLNKEYENSSSPSIVPMEGVNPDLISAINE